MIPPGHRATTLIAGVLRWGSYLSATLLFAGLVWAFVALELPLQLGRVIPLRMLAPELAAGNPYALMQLGILLLLLTPLLRIVAAAVSFHAERERRYTLVAVVVLTIILVGLMLARSHWLETRRMRAPTPRSFSSIRS